MAIVRFVSLTRSFKRWPGDGAAMKTVAVTLAALAAAVTIAGCGEQSGTAYDPGTIVPGSAYFYAEANLNPDGDQEDAVRTVLASLPGVGDPSRRLQEQFNAYAARRYGRRAARFERDIEP